MPKINFKAVAVGSIVAALLAPVAFDIWVVPLTMQSLVLFTLAAALGKNTGFWIGIVYLLLGALGLPVFADYQSGSAKLVGPTAGILWAYPFVCYYLGSTCEKGLHNFFHFSIYFFRAHLLILIPGFLVLYLMLPGVKLWSALIHLLPGLLIKSLVGGLLSLWLIKRLPPGWTEVSSSYK